MSVNISEVKVLTPSGGQKKFKEYKGKVLLIVNVASLCGFTKQYEGLQKLQDHFGDKGFQVLGFPCNDFGNQEPGNIDEIKQFCLTNYQATFPIFEKVHAKGSQITEPYKTLIKTKPQGDVEWNFEKFLVDREGTVLRRFKSSVAPESNELKSAIENALIK